MISDFMRRYHDIWKFKWEKKQNQVKRLPRHWKKFSLSKFKAKTKTRIVVIELFIELHKPTRFSMNINKLFPSFFRKQKTSWMNSRINFFPRLVNVLILFKMPRRAVEAFSTISLKILWRSRTRESTTPTRNILNHVTFAERTGNRFSVWFDKNSTCWASLMAGWKRSKVNRSTKTRFMSSYSAHSSNNWISQRHNERGSSWKLRWKIETLNSKTSIEVRLSCLLCFFFAIYI